MSESNQRLAIVCTFVLIGTAMRLYFGYESWDWGKDMASIATITGLAGGAVKLSEMLK